MLPKIKIGKRIGKKAVSIMIGYVLLVTIAIVMGAITYSWLKTYIPSESTECPEGVSLFIKNYSCSTGEFNLTIKNTGRFNITGYLIRVGNSTDSFATKDLSTQVSSGESSTNNAVIFNESVNFLSPGSEKTSIFTITNPFIDYIRLIEIVPTRFEEDGNKLKFVVCNNALIRNEIASCLINEEGIPL